MCIKDLNSLIDTIEWVVTKSGKSGILKSYQEKLGKSLVSQWNWE